MYKGVARAGGIVFVLEVVANGLRRIIWPPPALRTARLRQMRATRATEESSEHAPRETAGHYLSASPPSEREPLGNTATRTVAEASILRLHHQRPERLTS